MNLYAEILKEHSKNQTMKTVRYVGTNKKRFSELMKLFFGNEYRVTQRSAWAVSYCVLKHHELIKPYLKKMILNLKQPNLHDAVKRNTVKILQDINIPKNLIGLSAEACFNLLSSKTEPLAVKCYSISVLAKICKQEPDLKNELTLLIEKQLPYSTAGFRARARKVFKELEKLC